MQWLCPQLCCITFAFMAGQFPSFVGQGGSGMPAVCTAASFASGPESLWRWLVRWDQCHIFSRSFLIQWGAR